MDALGSTNPSYSSTPHFAAPLPPPTPSSSAGPTSTAIQTTSTGPPPPPTAHPFSAEVLFQTSKFKIGILSELNALSNVSCLPFIYRPSGSAATRVGQSVSGPFGCRWDGSRCSVPAPGDASPSTSASTPTPAHAFASTDLATRTDSRVALVRWPTAIESLQGHA